jgi:RNA polymerase sigma-70 factor (ECF subfamily)
MVRRCLRARWGASPLSQEVDDAVQEVFLECARERGALTHADPERGGGFRSFLFGVVRNVARRFETRGGGRRASDSALDRLAAEEDLAALLDREWARCLMAQAAEHHRRSALPRGDAARRRVELLRLRFEEGLPIRAIAARWDTDAAAVHAAYRTARREFQDALRKVVGFHQDGRGGAENLDAECRRLLDLLGES